MSQAGAGNGPGNGNPPSGPVSQQPQSGPDSTQYSGYFAQSGGGPPGGNGPQPNNGGPPSSGYASSGPMPNSYGAPQSGGRGGMHEGQGVPPPLMSKGSGYDPYDSGDSRGGGGHGMGGGYGGGGPGAGGGGGLLCFISIHFQNIPTKIQFNQIYPKGSFWNSVCHFLDKGLQDSISVD
ncbi:unnamed protein product [Anisakis simplex]|uniref:AT-rich interactive domain-containing protein 1B-like n=1 Tax=Anisakis simplex TaxID=6269 RepID=A0A0M3JI85_ANISI|nr:unnamed protein product [Anisakis simplex]